MTFSPDNRLLACANGHAFCLSEAATGKRLHEHGATPGDYVPADFEPAHSRPLVGFSGDSRIVASTSANHASVHLWEANSGKALRTLDVIDLLDYTLSPDGKLLATAGFGGKSSGAVWDIPTGKRRYGFSFLQPVFAPDGKTLAAVSVHQKQIVLCDGMPRSAATWPHLSALAICHEQIDSLIDGILGLQLNHLQPLGEQEEQLLGGPASLVAIAEFFLPAAFEHERSPVETRAADRERFTVPRRRFGGQWRRRPASTCFYCKGPMTGTAAPGCRTCCARRHGPARREDWRAPIG